VAARAALDDAPGATVWLTGLRVGLMVGECVGLV